ncbi:Uncharacterized protein TCAP_07227 [Tolypocladium capitatum]|uniref:Uncharacterized protein n=1 Tax=Tolypocladium capitatum TaxID=45235 RepID=A0A2K3Q267_9HYPO|nr:Uncharacterized protein TCAP_07227 [Tolypocladium capitatum]
MGLASPADTTLPQMFPDTMTRKLSARGFVSLLLLSYVVTGLAIRLPDEISRLIPGCAQECFISFLVLSYGTGDDGEIHSFEYLCSSHGNSEFTVGEGAVQCLVAEELVGSCSQTEAGGPVVSKALHMCSGQPDAVQPTHGVMTATMVLPPSGGSGPVSFPPPKSTHAKTTTTRAPPTSSDATLVVDTRTPSFSSPSATESSTLSTFVRSSSTQSSSTESSTATVVPAGVGDGKGPLTTGQKAGISVGVVAFAGLAVGLLFLLRCYRRKKNEDRQHSESTEALHRRDTWGYKVDKSGSSGRNSWMVQPTHPPRGPDSPSPSPPGAYSRASWRPSAIGLAITPTQSRSTQTTPPRRISMLLPAKPGLALGMPKKSSPLVHASSPPQQLRVVQPSPPSTRNKPQPPLPLKLEIPQQENFRTTVGGSKLGQARESAMTEFEEDGRTSQSPEGQIWKPPSAAPQSATTYYVADRYGNWVLGGPRRIARAAEPNVMRPMTANTPKASIANAVLLPVAQKAQKVESKSPRLPGEPKGVAATPAETKIAAEPSTLTSPDLGQQAMPRPLFSSNPNPRTVASARRSSARSMTRPRATSVDSGVTTITTSSEEFDDLQPPAPPQVNLSPVAESPPSGTGRVPVSYPRIHERNGGPVAAGKFTVVAPPRRPILYHPPGQPNPTPGLQQPPPLGGPGPSSSVPRGGGRGVQVEDPALLRTGSPTVRIVEPSPEPDDRSRLPSARHRSSSANFLPPPQKQQQPRPQLSPFSFLPEHQFQQPQQQYQQQQWQPPPRPEQQQEQQQQQPRRPPPNWVPGLPAHPHPLRHPQQPNTHWHPQQRHSQQYHCQHHEPQLRTYPSPYPNPHQGPPNHHHRQQSLPTPGNHQKHQRPLTASLVAKRLGTDRAAHMAISTSMADDGNPSSHQSSFRRESGGPLCLSPELVTPRQQVSGHLPATQTWIPRPAPSRRGDDLYLNVHQSLKREREMP